MAWLRPIALCGVFAMLMFVVGCPPPVTCETDADCDDGLFCNGAETCNTDTGICDAGTDPCAAGQTCDEAADTCETPCTVADCNDNNDCTDDTCGADGFCAFTVDNTNTCSDGNVCTENDACAGGVCSGIAIANCCTSDANCDTDQTCNLTTNTCEAAANTDLEAENAAVDFADLTVGDTVSLTAPDPTAAGAPKLFEVRQPPADCTCAWSVDPTTAGTFSDADMCTTDFTVDAGGAFMISVDVTCNGDTTSFDQDASAVEPAECMENADCDNGIFCEGVETCNLDTGACVDGMPPCDPDTETCAEGDTGAVCTPIPGACYAPGQPVTRSVRIDPPSGTLVYGVQSTPPAGWTVSGISNDGEFDSANNAVKWFFLDDVSRTLTYEATPPSGATGEQCFRGFVNFDGGPNLSTFTFCLARCGQ